MKLYNDDCLVGMKNIESKSIDMILTDLPFGMTNAKWDKTINLNLLFIEYNRIIKDNGVIALFGIEPFSSKLRLENIKYYKYDWIWIKDKATNHLNCRIQPMRKYENISIFYKKQCKYSPIIKEKIIKNIRPATKKRKNIDLYNSMDKDSKRTIPINMSYPCNVIYFNAMLGNKKTLHTSEKPVTLLEYLIKTYTNKNDLILDSCFGSGSTAVACKNLNRNFIGFEIIKQYYNIALDRLSL